ncbi:MAG: hypothetical protein NTV43_01720 [Methylococcales bacterium]|nr:hypothetical protein [Methylococcales bacterium]
MQIPRLLTATATLALLVGCAGPQPAPEQSGLTAACPPQNATSLVAEQGTLGPTSNTATLQCAVAVLRNSQDPAVRRTALGSRLCLLLAERETNPEYREKFATEGVDFAEAALALKADNDGAVHYYLAANLGLAVREHITLAMGNLNRLEREMKLAVDLSPNLDYGGPLRLLGTLYLKAPAWPNGVGDIDKALELLGKAAKEHPTHPLNHLFYAQALWEAGDTSTLSQVKTEFALGEKLLAEGDWGYNKAPWQKEFADFQQTLKEAG